MEHGADPSVCNKDSDDALQTAALHCGSTFGEYLIRLIKPTRQRRADVYALVASKKTIYKGGYTSAQDILACWYKSVNIRMEELTEDPDESVSVGPKEVYHFAVEAMDIDSLMNIAHDVDAMRM